MGGWSIPDYTQIMKVGWLVMHAACKRKKKKKKMQYFHINIIIIYNNNNNNFIVLYYQSILVSKEDDILKCITILCLMKTFCLKQELIK